MPNIGEEKLKLSCIGVSVSTCNHSGNRLIYYIWTYAHPMTQKSRSQLYLQQECMCVCAYFYQKRCIKMFIPDYSE